jgi:hypothetical protein
MMVMLLSAAAHGTNGSDVIFIEGGPALRRRRSLSTAATPCSRRRWIGALLVRASFRSARRILFEVAKCIVQEKSETVNGYCEFEIVVPIGFGRRIPLRHACIASLCLRLL